jgi:hypothetical protein
MKKLLLLSCIAGISALAMEHTCWMAPQKFFFTIRETANIRLWADTGLAAEKRNGKTPSVQYIYHHLPSGNIVNIAPLMNGAAVDSFRLPLGDEGTHMLVCNSAGPLIRYTADSFNAYLHANGLEQVSSYRAANHEAEQEGTAFLHYNTKTILQVGTKVTDACIHPTVLPLDIVPEENPYTVPLGTDRTKPVRKRFQVLFGYEPVGDVLVTMQYRDAGNRLLTDSARTNKRGWVTLTRHPGACLVSCVYMVRNTAGTAFQWQGYITALSFEYSLFFPGKSGIYIREH